MMGKVLGLMRKALVTLAVLLVLAVLTGAAYQEIATRRDALALPAPGRLIDIGGHRLHMDCRGEGSPMLLLESGAQLWSSGWRHIHNDLARDFRVCAYDRSGLGWSDAGPGPYDAETAVAELHRLLEASGEMRPFVFVGHSLGGMLARVYDARYPGELSAAVMIDSGAPEILIEDFEATRGDPLKPCGITCRAQVWVAYLGVTRIVLDNLGALDDPAYPPDAVDEFRALAARPAFIEAALLNARYVPTASFQTLDAGEIENLPVMALYSGNYGELVSAGETEEEMARWTAAYRASWTASVEASDGGSGPIEIPGANHITVIADRQHASAVSGHIRTFMKRL